MEVPNFLLPPQLHNDGNYIISLSKLARWLASKAEEMGVEIYAGFAADEVLYSASGAVRGVATKDAGIAKDGSLKETVSRINNYLWERTVDILLSSCLTQSTPAALSFSLARRYWQRAVAAHAPRQ